MELVITTVTLFILTFSILSMVDRTRYEKVNDRISDKFGPVKITGEARRARHSDFRLFPFEPSPLLFKKLKSLNELVSGYAPSLYTKFLGSLLVASLLGFTVASLGSAGLNLRYIDTLTLEIALFGSVFFLTRHLESRPTSKASDDAPSEPRQKGFSIFRWFFVIFAIVIPSMLWLAVPANMPATESFQSLPSFGRASIIEAVPEGAEGRLMSGIRFLWLVALLIPVYLFLFDLSEKRQQIERDIFENHDAGIAPITRIKSLASVALSMVSALVLLDVDLSSLSLFSGLVAAGLSVALRESITNFFSGLQMAWDGSLKVGHVISIPQGVSSDTGSTYGIVREIRNRYTVIEDRNTVRRLVPNYKMVSETIEHWTHQDKSVRLSLRIGIPYVDDPRVLRQAQRIMESVCYDVPRVLTTRPPNALLVGYDDSQLTFSLRFWIEDAENGIRPVISEVLISLYERLCDAGIRIPFPQQEIHIKELPIDYRNFTASLVSPVTTGSAGSRDGQE